MHDVLLILAYTTASCAAAGGIGLLVLSRLRHRRLRLTVFITALVPVVAVGVSAIVNVQAMFLSRHDSLVVMIALGWAFVIAVVMTWMVSRYVDGGSDAIRVRLQQLDTNSSGQAPAGTASDRSVRDHATRPGTPAELTSLVAELDTIRERLVASRRREQALESSRRELVSFMSHDLRTPLTGLRVLAEGLDDGVIDDVPAATARIRGYVDRMTSLVEDLFELSRVTSGATRRANRMVSIAEIMLDVVGEAEDMARSLDVAVKLDLTPDGDRLAVMGNGDELARAMTNLVTNALRHTRPGGVVMVHGDRTQDVIRVSVTDRCGGIPPADLPFVFDAGWRGSPHRSDDGGAGLGLAIVHGIADSHRGRVGVANIDGGCRFELALPVV